MIEQATERETELHESHDTRIFLSVLLSHVLRKIEFFVFLLRLAKSEITAVKIL